MEEGAAAARIVTAGCDNNHSESAMLHRVIPFVVAVILTACASTSPKTQIERFDRSLLLPKPCKADAKNVLGTWYVNVQRDFQSPDQREKFAHGAFDARITVWVTFENGQQLVTVTIGASEDGVRVDTGSVSTGRMITGEKITSVDDPNKCEAFAPASA